MSTTQVHRHHVGIHIQVMDFAFVYSLYTKGMIHAWNWSIVKRKPHYIIFDTLDFQKKTRWTWERESPCTLLLLLFSHFLFEPLRLPSGRKEVILTLNHVKVYTHNTPLYSWEEKKTEIGESCVFSLKKDNDFQKHFSGYISFT